MSFSHAPFEHLEFNVYLGAGPSGSPLFEWHCESCGGDSHRRFTKVNLGEAYDDFLGHLRTSHRLEPPKPPCQFSTVIGHIRYRCTIEAHLESEAHRLEAVQ